MNKKIRPLLLFFLALSLAPYTFAIDEFTATRQKSKTKKVLPKNLSVFASLIMGGTVTDESQSEGTRTGTLALRPTYELGSDYSLSLDIAFTQELEIKQFYTSNMDVLVNMPRVSWEGDLSLDTSMAAVVSTDHDAYRDQTFRGGAYLYGRLAKKVLAESFPLNLSYSLIAGKNFHKFRRSNTSATNTSIYTNHNVYIAKNISKLSLGFSTTYAPKWDYDGTYKPAYALAQRLAYSDKGITYALTHSNGGSALDYQGDVDNVRFFDNYNSRINLSLSYNLQ